MLVGFTHTTMSSLVVTAAICSYCNVHRIFFAARLHSASLPLLQRLPFVPCARAIGVRCAFLAWWYCGICVRICACARSDATFSCARWRLTFVFSTTSLSLSLSLPTIMYHMPCNTISHVHVILLSVIFYSAPPYYLLYLSQRRDARRACIFCAGGARRHRILRL